MPGTFYYGQTDFIEQLNLLADSVGGVLADTDDLDEGSLNLYFTEDRVRGTDLAGLSLVSTANIDTSSTALVAFGRLQAQNTANLLTLTNHIGSGGGAHANAVAAGAAGFMTGADKTKLDAVSTAANLLADTDTSLAANSHTRAATQAAVKAYIDAAVVGLLDFKGNTDASANPNYPAALKGDSYLVSVAGKIGGASGTVVAVGDMYVASADNAGGTQASVGVSWFVLEKNLAGALLAANDLSDLSSVSTARSNLGLGTLATQSGTFSGTSSGTNTGDEDSASVLALLGISSISGNNTGDQLSWKDIVVSGQTTVVPDSANDALTLIAGTNTTITTSGNSITINSTGGGGGSAIEVLDEGGAPITIALASLNFVGSGVAATAIGDDVTITISGAGLTDTDDLTEGSLNLYFTEARVRGTDLAGLSTASASVITAAETALQAFGQLQAQITANATAANAYADGLVVGLLDDRGNYNASGNAFPSSGGSGAAGAILKGDLWTISVAGTLGGHPVTAGDILRALIDTPGTTDANWAISENNLGYVAENSANKVTSISGASTDTQYPSAKLTYDQLALKANLAAPAIVGGSHTALTGLGIRSISAAFDLTMATSEVLTAGRTLSWNVGDAARSITLAGNLAFSGAFSTSGAFGTTVTVTGTTTVTLPTSGTLLSTAAAVTAPQGGTGQTTYAVGDLLYASTTSALSRLAAVATGNVLISGGLNTASSWAKVGLTTHVSGLLPGANGGTGVDNTGKTITLGGNFATSGAYAATFTLTGTTTVTFPTSGTLAILGANTFTGAQIFSDQLVSRMLMKDNAEVFVDKGSSSTTTQTLDFTAGGHQKVTATGNHTWAISNWPPTGNTGFILFDMVNYGAYTITHPTINWVKSDGSTTTTFSANGVTLQSSGTDRWMLWSSDAGTTVYGVVIRGGA